jgi:hypothetical protein
MGQGMSVRSARFAGHFQEIHVNALAYAERAEENAPGERRAPIGGIRR